VIAREHGFESWPKLVHHVESVRPEGIARFERFADTIARAYVNADVMAVREFNRAHNTSFVWDRDAERMRQRLPEWYASTSRDMELASSDARHLVARQAGFDSWSALIEHLAAQPRVDDAGAGASVRSPLYRVNERDRTIEVHGALPEQDWDTVFSVMKELGLTGLRGAGQISDEALKRLARLEHVTNLDLSGAKQLTYAGLQHIARLPLESLDLGGWGTRIEDSALAVLRELRALRRVSLMWAQRVSDTGVSHLAACEHLEGVNLFATPTGDGALRALAGKARLAHLDAGTLVTPGGLEALREYPVFRSAMPAAFLDPAHAADSEPSFLGLHPGGFNRGGLEPLAALPGILSLRLFTMDSSVPPIARRALEPVVGMPALESLWCDPSDDAMAVIAAMPRLRKLSCQDTGASDDGWVALSRSRSIEQLWGRRNTGLHDRGFLALAEMPRLRALAINLGQVSDAALASLPRFPCLRELTAIGLGDTAFQHVGACTALESLACMYTQDMGDAATRHIVTLRSLRTYYAGDTRITDVSLELLALLPSLESVELWDCPAVTNEGLRALAAAPRLRQVKAEGLPLVTREARLAFPASVRVDVMS
jgi:hypothetical protein